MNSSENVKSVSESELAISWRFGKLQKTREQFICDGPLISQDWSVSKSEPSAFESLQAKGYYDYEYL